MADAPPSTAKSSGSTFGFLGKKVFGKIPVWVIAVGAVGAWYWYTHYGPGKKTMQTDPAGNRCATINAATGFCPGTPEDIAANTAAAAAGSTSGTDTGTGTSGAAAGDTSGGAAGGGDGGAGGAGGGGAGDTGTYIPPAVTGTTPDTTAAAAAAATAAAASAARTTPTKVPPSRQRTVTVRPGQTLAQIAAANGVSREQLAHANTYIAGEAPGKAPGTTLGTGAGLKTGQTLVIPKTGTRRPAATRRPVRTAPVKGKK